MTHTKSLGFRRDAKAAANAVLFSLALPFFLHSPSAFAIGRNPNPLRNESVTPLVEKAPDKMSKDPSCKVKGNGIEYVFSGGKTKSPPINLRDGERLVESACDDDRGFIRTDRRLFATTVVAGEGDSAAWYIPWFDISFPADGTQMIAFRGVVFIASDERIVAYRFNRNDSLPLLIAPHPGAKFSIKDNRLFYGKEGGKTTEIKVEKNEEFTYQLNW